MKEEKSSKDRFAFFLNRTCHRYHPQFFHDQFRLFREKNGIVFELKDIKDLNEMLGHITKFCQESLAKYWSNFSEKQQECLKLYLISIIYNNRAVNNPKIKNNPKIEEKTAKNRFISEAIQQLANNKKENVFEN